MTSPIPRKLANLHPNSQLGSKPKSPPAGLSNSAETKRLGGEDREKCETTNSVEGKNALHFLGFKYLAGSKVLSSGPAMDSNDLALPKAELC